MWPLIALAVGQGLVNYFSGRAQGQASEKAAGQLQEGVREARAYAEPKYAEALRIAAEQHAAGQAGLAPYAAQGGQGLTALTALLGLPATQTAAPATATTPPPGLPVGAPLAPASAPSALVNGRGVPLSMLDNLTTKQIAEANRATGGAFLGGGSPGATPASTSSYVRLRAPTGEERPVPADQVGFYLARGATRV